VFDALIAELAAFIGAFVEAHHQRDVSLLEIRNVVFGTK